jgi:hypothetical protein
VGWWLKGKSNFECPHGPVGTVVTELPSDLSLASRFSTTLDVESVLDADPIIRDLRSIGFG